MLLGLILSLLMLWYCIEINLVYLKKNWQIESAVLHHLYINGNNTNECHQVSCLRVGQMHLAVRSRSTSKKLRQESATCEACDIVTDLFVAILANIEPVRHYIICLDCYQRDTWQTKINLKELTTKTGSSNGSQKLASKQKEYHSAVPLEENTQVTSTSTSTEENWWEKESSGISPVSLAHSQC